MADTKPKAVFWKNIMFLRGAAIAAVAFNHTTINSIRWAKQVGHDWDVSEIGLLIFGQLVAPTCIPLFIFAAAYLMGRFVRTWAAAKKAVRPQIFRYLAWSIGMFGVRYALGDDIPPLDVVWGIFVVGEAFPAYWFALVIIELYLVLPWFSKWTNAHPKRMLGVAAAILAVAIAHTYASKFGADFAHWLHLTAPMMLPYFILGLFAAKKGDAIGRALGPHRGKIGVGVLVTFVLCVGEAIALGYVTGDGAPKSWHWEWSDRFFYHLFVMFLLPYLLLTPSKDTKVRAVLNWIGVRSFSVLLLLDFTIRCSLFVLKQFGERGPSGLPDWIGNAWVSMPVFAATLAVPLGACYLLERFFGANVRTRILG